MSADSGPAMNEVFGQTRAVAGWKAVEYAGLLVFTVVVPRVMGPARFGELALLLSFVALLALINGVGALATFGRFVPEYRVREEDAEVRVLFTQLFVVRACFGLILAGVFASAFPVLLPSASGIAVAGGAAAVAIGAAAATCFDLFYGLNALGRWLSREALSRPLLLVLLVSLGGLWSIERAALALLAMQAGFFAVGLVWGRFYLVADPRVLDPGRLGAHLVFGLAFFGVNLLLLGVWRAGEVMIQLLSGATDEVAYFNVANSLALTVATLLGQLAVMLGPSLASMYATSRQREIDQLLGYSLKYLTIGAFIFLIGVELCAEWAIVVVLGEPYRPVAANLNILALGLLPIGVTRTAISLAVLEKKPRSLLPVTGLALVVFAGGSALLIPALGGRGAAIAVALALWCAGLVSGTRFPLAQAMSIARLGRLALCGAPVAAFVALPSGSISPLWLLLYVPALFLSRAVTPREVRGVAVALLGGVGSEVSSAPADQRSK